MKIPLWLCFSSCILLKQTTALPNLSKREADFHSVASLSQLDRPFLENKVNDAQEYFRPSSFDNLYDGRFAKQPLDPKTQHLALKALVRSYLLSMNDAIGVPTWLMHSTLLSWFRTRNLHPNSSRVDVMVSPNSMQFLAEFCNMTVYEPRLEGAGKRKKYLLEVSPFWNQSLGNGGDARWIDTHSGLFIDILMDGGTGDADAAASYPLVETVFEGVAARVPVRYAEVLLEEYGQQATFPLPTG